MASPVVEEVIENVTAAEGTSHVINLPTATAGQLLLILLEKGKQGTIDAHGSLSELLNEDIIVGLYIAYRWMDGTEPSSYTLTSSASMRTASFAYRISGTADPGTQAPEIAGTTATSSGTTPNPPASATPGSSKDYLFIAFFGSSGEEADDDTWCDVSPTNYTPDPPRMKAAGIAGTNLGGIIAATERALTTGSAENPGTFTKDASGTWRSQTVMVHPGAGAQQDLTGTTFTRAPTFPQGAIAAIYALVGTTFQKAPTFAAGVVGRGAVNLAGVTFQRAPTFATGTVGRGAVDLAGIVFQKAPAFGSGTLSQQGGPQMLAGAVFTKAPTFPQAAVGRGAVNLGGTTFQRAPTFGTGQVGAGLTGTVFIAAPTFPQGALTTEAALAGVTFLRAPTFPGGTIGAAGALSGITFLRAPTFYQGSVAHAIQYPEWLGPASGEEWLMDVGP